MELTQEQALSVLVQAVRFAQTKGVFSLEDAEVISKAVKLFFPPEKQEKQEEQAEQAEQAEATKA
jgi:hypothetical protein